MRCWHSGQSVHRCNDNEKALCIPQSSSIMGASPSDCLLSLPGHSLKESYPSAVKQSVYSIAPAYRAPVQFNSFLIWQFYSFRYLSFPAKLQSNIFTVYPIMLLIFTPLEFFESALADGLSLEFQWQQISRTFLSILVLLVVLSFEFFTLFLTDEYSLDSK